MNNINVSKNSIINDLVSHSMTQDITPRPANVDHAQDLLVMSGEVPTKADGNPSNQHVVNLAFAGLSASSEERSESAIEPEEFEYHADHEEVEQPEVVRDNSDLGICAENVAAIAARQPKVKTKSTLLDEIRGNGEEMAEFHATPMLLARTVGSFLESKGLGRSSAGEPLKSYQVLGDMLGSGGCNLPRIRIRGKMVYALRFVNSSPEEKAEAQGRLDSLTSIERKAMKIA
ncbi:MAG: hypothetical protein V4675_09900 [Verrucomicrobiota bacterium]